MADVAKEHTQTPEQDPIWLAKTRAAQRIKALFHSEKEATMDDQRAVELFLKRKSLEKQKFNKEKQLQELNYKIWYIAPRSTLEKRLKQAA